VIGSRSLSSGRSRSIPGGAGSWGGSRGGEGSFRAGLREVGHVEDDDSGMIGKAMGRRVQSKVSRIYTIISRPSRMGACVCTYHLTPYRCFSTALSGPVGKRGRD